MESRNRRRWFTPIGIAALFSALGMMPSCGSEEPTGVGQGTEILPNGEVSVRVDSIDNSTDDNCYWVGGQWICTD